MFGHDDNNQNQPQMNQTTTNDPALVAPTPDGSLSTDQAMQASGPSDDMGSDDVSAPLVDNQSSPSTDNRGQSTAPTHDNGSDYRDEPPGNNHPDDNDAASTATGTDDD